MHNLYDFNWSEHAFGILQQYIPQFANALQAESEYAFQMTNGMFGREKLNTTQFRNSIVMYLMLIFGIKDDSVRYSNMN